jgi:hypothetical protein
MHNLRFLPIYFPNLASYIAKDTVLKITSQVEEAKCDKTVADHFAKYFLGTSYLSNK